LSRSKPAFSNGSANSSACSIIGAAARKACLGDRIIICSYAAVDLEEAKTHKPKIVVLGASNKIERITDRPTVE
jgi:aspartate 1-decarboxylase